MIRPILQAMVLADQVYEDKSTGKKVIAGTFNTLLFARRPTQPPLSPDTPSTPKRPQAPDAVHPDSKPNRGFFDEDTEELEDVFDEEDSEDTDDFDETDEADSENHPKNELKRGNAIAKDSEEDDGSDDSDEDEEDEDDFDETSSPSIVSDKVAQNLPARHSNPGQASNPHVQMIQQLRQAGSPSLYLSLTEVIGHIQLRLRYVDLDDNQVLFEIEMEATSSDPLRTMEYTLPLPSLPAPHTGVYVLELLFGEEPLGSLRITARETN